MVVVVPSTILELFLEIRDLNMYRMVLKPGSHYRSFGIINSSFSLPDNPRRNLVFDLGLGLGYLLM